MRRYAPFWAEDLGARGDVTTRWALPDPRVIVSGRIFARRAIVASGLRHARALLSERRVRVLWSARDGARVRPGGTLLKFRGRAEGVLGAERLVLNVLGRMSGISTLTRRVVDRVRRANPRCRVAGTRKTTPGFRAFEKEAIVHGGGVPHRMGLFDAVLVKDNHLALIPDLSAAVGRLRRRARGLAIEVEVTNLRRAVEAAAARVDWILIDNQSVGRARAIARAARAVHPRVRIEVSGGLDERSAPRYAPFSDRLSLGLLTHSAPAADLALELFPKP